MAATTFESKHRNIIPRWRDSKTTKLTSELASLGSKRAGLLDGQQFQQKLRDWEEAPSISSAAELLNAAIVLGKKEAAVVAARYLVGAKGHLPDVLFRTAISLLDPPQTRAYQFTFSPTFESRESIRRLRLGIRQYARNPIAWVDLSREYAITGQLAQARHAMDVALILAPANRFVVRSAARLYVHLEDAGHAHDILVRAASAHRDPWLIAAELAVAGVANTAPEFVFEARRLLNACDHAPLHLSEMTSALATLEMSNGNNKKARKLFLHALEDPTENTVAQVNWATEELGRIRMSPRVLEVPRLFEARSWGFYRAGKWRDALDQSFDWLDDQPFSSRPAIHGSYIASALLEDFEAAERIARTGLNANPREFGLLNNLAVVLARTGRVKEAVRYFEMINHSHLTTAQRVVCQATAGLLYFRNRQFEEGRGLYRKAIENAVGREMASLRAQAALAQATEELYAATTEAREAAQKALTLAEVVSGFVIDTLIARVKTIHPHSTNLEQNTASVLEPLPPLKT